MGYDEIELKEEEEKGLIYIEYIKNKNTKQIDVKIRTEGNKIDLTEVLIFILRNDKELELQSLFEAVKDYV